MKAPEPWYDRHDLLLTGQVMFAAVAVGSLWFATKMFRGIFQGSS